MKVNSISSNYYLSSRQKSGMPQFGQNKNVSFGNFYIQRAGKPSLVKSKKIHPDLSLMLEKMSERYKALCEKALKLINNDFGESSVKNAHDILLKEDKAILSCYGGKLDLEMTARNNDNQVNFWIEQAAEIDIPHSVNGSSPAQQILKPAYVAVFDEWNTGREIVLTPQEIGTAESISGFNKNFNLNDTARDFMRAFLNK